jgi:ABC-type lipoprotein release transport system permease subunit
MLSINVLERRREIGGLHSIGASSGGYRHAFDQKGKAIGILLMGMLVHRKGCHSDRDTR